VLQLEGRRLPPDFLRGKIVFVGFDPSVDTRAGANATCLPTPYTRFGHDFAPGVEVLANSCANLLNHDALRRMDYLTQAAVAALFGAVAVAVLLLTGRPWMLAVAGSALLRSAVGVARRPVGLSGLVELAGAGGGAAAAGGGCLALSARACRAWRSSATGARAQGFCGDAHTGSARARLRGVPRREGHPGRRVVAAAEAGITSTRNFILVLSPGMFDGTQGRLGDREILHAQASGRKIIPVMQDGFPVSSEHAHRNAVSEKSSNAYRTATSSLI